MKYLSKKLYFIKHKIFSVRSDLLGLFAIAILIILLTDLVKSTYFQTSMIINLVELLYKLCLAYITGFIFYFINVHLQLERTRVKTYTYIHNKIHKINQIRSTLIGSLRSAYPTNINFQTIDEEVTYLCNNINPHAPFRFGGWYNINLLHWFAGFEFITMETKEIINDLFIFRDTLDSDITRILLDIENNLVSFLNCIWQVQNALNGN